MATTYRNYKRLDNSDKFFDKKTGDIISRDTYEKLFLSEHKDKIQYATVEQPRPRRTPVHEGTIKKEGLAEFNSNLGSLFGGRDFASRTKRAILTMGLSEEKGRKIYSDMIGNAALLSTGGGGIVADASKFGALKFGTEMFTHGDAREAGKEAFWEAGAIGALGLLGKVGSAIYHSPVGRRVAAVVGATTYGIGAASQIPTQTKEEREAALDWKQIMTDIQSSANPVPASASVPLEAVLRVRQASKAGDTNRFANSRNFLATDKVPDTIFGIPIVSKREDYTEEDIAFFKEHPEAGGYYDMGEGTPEDGSDEGAPVQADYPPVKPPENYGVLYINGASDEQRNAWIRGGSQRQYSQNFEFKPGEKLDVRTYRQRDGSLTYMVKPRSDRNGNYDAGGYRYFKNKTTGKYVANSNDKEMSLAQYLENADQFDRDSAAKTTEIMAGIGIDGEDIRNLVNDHLFVSGIEGGAELLSRGGSPTMFRRFDALRKVGVDENDAFRMAWLSEADTYHRGNDRRVLGRSADMLTALRKSGNDVVKRFLKAFDDGAAAVPYDRSSKSRTEEKQRMDAHRAGQKALADSLDRIGESRRKKGTK